jgi:transglutaminase-like putative cysteine protease
MKKIYILGIFIFIVLIGASYFLFYPKNIPATSQDNYTTQRINAGISEVYTLGSSDYDYYDPSIQKIINEIKKENYSTTEQIVSAVGNYVYLNIDYNGDLTYYDCVNNNASSINQRGYGLCSTMSKLDITILRGLGIASRPMTGCVNVNNYQCNTFVATRTRIQAQSIFNFLNRKPKSGEVTILDGIAQTKGGLHTWVEVWIPEKGWTILEPTTGYLINGLCSSYEVFKVNPNSNEMCGLSYVLYKNKINQCSLF